MYGRLPPKLFLVMFHECDMNAIDNLRNNGLHKLVFVAFMNVMIKQQMTVTEWFYEQL